MAQTTNKYNNALSSLDQDEEKTTDKVACEFSIGSFNVLCPYWNNSESKEPKLWKKRHNEILKILCTEHDNKKDNHTDAMNCDIYCLQEFWCQHEPFVRLYESYLKARGYALHLLKRSSKYKPDGLAVIINKKTFKVLNKIHYTYSLNTGSRVAIMMELCHLKSNRSINIGTTHLTFPHNQYDDHLRALQGSEFVDLLTKNTSNSVSNIIICGDFNCEIDGNECEICLKDGYKSTFHVVNPDIKGSVVSHFNHNQQSVFVDHIFYKRNPTVVKEHSCTMIPIDSYLYPRNMESDKWNNDWILSDHRPIVSTFQLKADD
eukprot:282103_1